MWTFLEYFTRVFLTHVYLAAYKLLKGGLSINLSIQRDKKPCKLARNAIFMHEVNINFISFFSRTVMWECYHTAVWSWHFISVPVITIQSLYASISHCIIFDQSQYFVFQVLSCSTHIMAFRIYQWSTTQSIGCMYVFLMYYACTYN